MAETDTRFYRLRLGPASLRNPIGSVSMEVEHRRVPLTSIRIMFGCLKTSLVMCKSSVGRMKPDRPEPSISLDLAHGLLNAFRVMCSNLLECKLPLQIVHKRKQFDEAAGVQYVLHRWPRHEPNIQTRIHLPLVL